MRLKYFLLVFIVGFPLVAQTYRLGSKTDPCSGGTPYTIVSNGATLRFGDFTCTFLVQTTIDKTFQVTLGFQEPCPSITIPGCAAMTGINQRAQNVYVNGTLVLSGLDMWKIGAQNGLVTSWMWATSKGSQITVRVQQASPGTRAAVLSTVQIVDTGVSVPPTPPGPIGTSCAVTVPTLLVKFPDGSCLPTTVSAPSGSAAASLDLSLFDLIANTLTSSAPGGSAIYLNESTPPTSTTDATGRAWGAVIYIDPTDHKVKKLRLDGTVDIGF